jgi:outer membrane protein assembly factor BamB
MMILEGIEEFLVLFDKVGDCPSSKCHIQEGVMGMARGEVISGRGLRRRMIMMGLAWATTVLGFALPSQPYLNRGWPTLHYDRHNSDHVPQTFGVLKKNYPPRLVQWILKDAENPMVSLLGGTVGNYDGVDVFFVTPGKVFHSNLYAFDLSDGALLWKAAPPHAEAGDYPGPGPCATSHSTLLDDSGRIYVADCHYIYCYRLDDGLYNSLGEKAWVWREVMPNTRFYDPSATPLSSDDWFWTLDPTANAAIAKPFIDMQFTPMHEGQSFLVGVSVAGDVAVMNRDDGSLVAMTHLEKDYDYQTPVDYGEPCDPYQMTIDDDPMHFVPLTSDGLMPMGIWCSGSNTGEEVPPAPNPDLDYFMNPCQINKYLGANTGGVGSMVTNTPAIAQDPRPGFGFQSRIFVPGEASAYLDGFDEGDPQVKDAILYRIDFDPTAIPGNRLSVRNNVEIAGEPVFYGRMADGENSAASPDLNLSEQWLVTAGNDGKFYSFETETGQPTWTNFGLNGYLEIGTLLSTATLLQRVEANGNTYVLSFGDSMVWVIGVDPETGIIRPRAGSVPPRPDLGSYDFRPYLLEHCWRPEPAYQQTYGVDGNGDGDLNDPEDSVYERVAVAASILSATDDLVFSVYSLGWRIPDVPDAFFIPTHSVHLVLDLELLLAADPATTAVETLVAGAYLDLRGTSESGIIPALVDGLPKGVVIYGSQSTTMAQFMDVNDLMVDEVKPLYLRPHGGLAIMEYLSSTRQVVDRWPEPANVLDLVLFVQDEEGSGVLTLEEN